ncbi:tetratricopeptide repeat protein [Nocardia sp. NPDC055321]
MYGSKDGAVAQDMLRAALAALERHEYETALERISAVLDEQPDNATAWRVRASAHRELASASRGKVARVREHRIESIVAARRAVELAPGDVENLRMRALTLLVASPADALVALDKAVRLDPADATLYELRAAVRADLQEQEIARRVAAAERARDARQSEDSDSDGRVLAKIAFGAVTFIAGIALELGLGDSDSSSDRPTPHYPTRTYTKPYPTQLYPPTVPQTWPTMPAR